jgi:PAS domain S-box-containing protein
MSTPGACEEGSGSALLDWDLRSGELFVSEQWGRILGGPPAHSVMRIEDLRSLVHPEDTQAFATALDETLSGARPFLRIEYRIRAVTGEWRWIETHARVMERDAQGEAARLTGTSADITDRKDVERRQAEFVSTVSHELRTPLTSILGALDVVMDEHKNEIPPDSRKFFEIAYRNAARLSGLVDSILDLERVERGLHGFRYSAVPVGEFLARAVELNSAYALRYSVQLLLQEPPADLNMWVDADRLMQVVTNLLSNAVKFSPQGDAVQVSAQATGTHVRILVKDRGPGVPSEFRNRIFQRFSQADTLDPRQRAGSGLGLSISKALIERMAGDIGFEPQQEGGTVFYVTVPRAGAVLALEGAHR